MAIQIRSILKGWFSTGKKPTASQFADWIDSFWHKSEDDIPADKIDGLQDLLDEKVSDAPADGNTYGRKDKNWIKIDVSTGGAAETEIKPPAAWDGVAHTIDISTPYISTLTVNDGVTSAEFAVSFASDSASKSREVSVVVDNSGNSSAIETITFPASMTFAAGGKPTGLAAGATAVLYIYNLSATEVIANWQVNEE